MKISRRKPHVQYDDDDEEEFDEKDVKNGLRLYAQHSEKDPSPISEEGAPSGSAAMEIEAAADAPAVAAAPAQPAAAPVNPPPAP